MEIVKKVPADQCEEVPGVKCFFELVDVEAPVCHEVPVKDSFDWSHGLETCYELTVHKVPVEECIDELQETPFLVDTEQCEDVPKLVCTEVRVLFLDL